MQETQSVSSINPNAKRGRHTEQCAATLRMEKEQVRVTYQNCWVIVRKVDNRQDQYALHRKESAQVILEVLMRETVKHDPVSASILLSWYDSEGQEHRLANTKLGRKI